MTLSLDVPIVIVFADTPLLLVYIFIVCPPSELLALTVLVDNDDVVVLRKLAVPVPCETLPLIVKPVTVVDCKADVPPDCVIFPPVTNDSDVVDPELLILPS
jgi:hypothetical protein